MIPPSEDGEVRTGCFSDDSDDIRLAFDRPKCPICGSDSYTLLSRQVYPNCKCDNCNTEYTFVFNK